MISAAQLGLIRRWHASDDISIREIARRLGISRNTVRRYIRSNAVEASYAKRHGASALDAFAPTLCAWLSVEAAKPGKPERTLKQMFLDLEVLGYKGSYDRVAAFGRRWRAQRVGQAESARKSMLDPAGQRR